MHRFLARIFLSLLSVCIDCHLHVAASSAAQQRSARYTQRCSPHVQQPLDACPIARLHPSTNPMAFGAPGSVSLPRPLITHRTRYNAQAMHKVLDNRKHCLHTCSGAVLDIYRVPVITTTNRDGPAYAGTQSADRAVARQIRDDILDQTGRTHRAVCLGIRCPAISDL
ncbi:hypothetical protein C7974DRAFT_406643 [Boeremia exigua]|uniref:uncharacterized protein n=1 Tax=Boeremia exigua TaxID=749465 RepID=UPI001E8E7095|nr:uncharacterized protein C7974DRAFT_406643 [Boeremia exigua]KAH6611947.1 hypothetical protein C7974DRAFT_406643 [Boeremia exigua]